MWGEEGRKKERLPLEAETEAETIEQEDETVSETIEQEDETVSETIEQKLNPWESKGGEGEGKGIKPETMNQNVGDRNLNRVTEGKGIVTVKKHQVWQRDADEKVLGVGLGLAL